MTASIRLTFRGPPRILVSGFHFSVWLTSRLTVQEPSNIYWYENTFIFSHSKQQYNAILVAFFIML